MELLKGCRYHFHLDCLRHVNGFLFLAVFLSRIIMRDLSVEAELSALTKGFKTAVDAAHVGLEPRMRVLVLLQVLGQHESLGALGAHVLFVVHVDHDVPLE